MDEEPLTTSQVIGTVIYRAILICGAVGFLLVLLGCLCEQFTRLGLLLLAIGWVGVATRIFGGIR